MYIPSQNLIQLMKSKSSKKGKKSDFGDLKSKGQKKCIASKSSHLILLSFMRNCTSEWLAIERTISGDFTQHGCSLHTVQKRTLKHFDANQRHVIDLNSDAIVHSSNDLLDVEFGYKLPKLLASVDLVLDCLSNLVADFLDTQISLLRWMTPSSQELCTLLHN
eukprot:scpid103405/ scgid25651/ 